MTFVDVKPDPTPTRTRPIVQVNELRHVFATKTTSNVALDSVTFDVHAGSVVAVVGPSGAGKTTVLRCLSGLLEPTDGTVSFDGAPITGVPDGIAAVFQDYRSSLLPWLSARGNVMLPLRSRGVKRAEARERADAALSSVGLEGREDAHPWELSGGMQQRVALARALASRPRLLLMDEPFASLDAQTRLDLEDLVLSLQHTLGTTVLIVTHDIDEAVYLADSVVVLSGPPTVTQQIVDIPLDAPRSQIATKDDPRFAQLRHHILTLIRPDTSSNKENR